MLAAALSLVPLAASSDAERPSWKAGHSVCHSFEGFQPTDLFPIRSPLIVADFLGPQLATRQVQTPPRLAARLAVVSWVAGPSLALLPKGSSGTCHTPGAWAAAALAVGGGGSVVPILRRDDRSVRSARVTATSSAASRTSRSSSPG